MRRVILLLGAATALLTGSQAASAQMPPLMIEVHGGYTIESTGNWNELATYKNGSGAGATVTAMVAPQIGVYLGWDRYRFRTDEEQPGVAPDAFITHAGYRAGLTVFIPIRAVPAVTPVLEAGSIYNTVAVSLGDGRRAETRRSGGREAGVGVMVRVTPRLNVAPTFRIREHKVEFEDGSSQTMGYFALGVGLRVRL